jgi:hypothetical protein
LSLNSTAGHLETAGWKPALLRKCSRFSLKGPAEFSSSIRAVQLNVPAKLPYEKDLL